jgi:hypothetical protein
MKATLIVIETDADHAQAKVALLQSDQADQF